MHKPKPPSGQRLIVDPASCPHHHLLSDLAHIETWVEQLIEAIDMQAYAKPSNITALAIDRGVSPRVLVPAV